MEHATDVDKVSTKEGKKTRKPVADGIEAIEILEQKVAKKN